jgi:hypothetical protein
VPGAATARLRPLLWLFALKPASFRRNPALPASRRHALVEIAAAYGSARRGIVFGPLAKSETDLLPLGAGISVCRWREHHRRGEHGRGRQIRADTSSHARRPSSAAPRSCDGNRHSVKTSRLEANGRSWRPAGKRLVGECGVATSRAPAADQPTPANLARTACHARPASRWLDVSAPSNRQLNARQHRLNNVTAAR